MMRSCSCDDMFIFCRDVKIMFLSDHFFIFLGLTLFSRGSARGSGDDGPLLMFHLSFFGGCSAEMLASCSFFRFQG